MTAVPTRQQFIPMINGRFKIYMYLKTMRAEKMKKKNEKKNEKKEKRFL
jgi:hypothetical protein